VNALREVTVRTSAALVVLPLLLVGLLLLGGPEQLFVGAALVVAGAFLTGLVVVRTVVAHLQSGVVPPDPVLRRETADTLPQNEPAAVGNPQPRAPESSPLPC
jgi:hypothetical protein